MSIGTVGLGLVLLVLASNGARALGQQPEQEQAGSRRPPFPGWREERDDDYEELWWSAEGDMLSLSLTGDKVETKEGALRKSSRKLAQNAGAGLIEVAVLPGRRANWLIYKKLRDGAYSYTGMLHFRSGKEYKIWTTISRERGKTGVREAIVTVELIKSGQLTVEGYKRTFAQDPYDPGFRGVDQSVLRFLSDDEKYDERFPGHPLSKVRKTLAALAAQLP